MMVHSVFFWLKPELSQADRAAFQRGLQSLSKVSTIEQMHVGTPAPIPPRPVVDQTYSYALTLLFKDVAGHDAYQVDPIHRAFVDSCKAYWTRVQIYDSL